MLAEFLNCEGINSSQISSSWPDGEQGLLAESDENAERGSEEKKAWFVEGGKNGCSIVTVLQCISPF
jgi:hypothetical protein